jgi:protein transport protein SEC24
MPLVVSPEYFSNLDWQSRRLDHESRPELNLGSVDFRVPKEYWTQDDQANPGAAARQPAPMSYVFAIDVSWTSVSCGMVKEATQAIKTILYGDAGKEGEAAEGRPLGVPYGAKVAILTFDRTVHFYSLKVSTSQPTGNVAVWRHANRFFDDRLQG